jgi:hypothetical protein
MYTGGGDDGGADGQCVSVGANTLAGRNGEDGVAEGLALCFDGPGPPGALERP